MSDDKLKAAGRHQLRFDAGDASFPKPTRLQRPWPAGDLKIPEAEFRAAGGLFVGGVNIQNDPLQPAIDNLIGAYNERTQIDAVVAGIKAQLLGLAIIAQRIHDKLDATSSSPLADALNEAAALL